MKNQYSMLLTLCAALGACSSDGALDLNQASSALACASGELCEPQDGSPAAGAGGSAACPDGTACTYEEVCHHHGTDCSADDGGAGGDDHGSRDDEYGDDHGSRDDEYGDDHGSHADEYGDDRGGDDSHSSHGGADAGLYTGCADVSGEYDDGSGDGCSGGSDDRSGPNPGRH